MTNNLLIYPTIDMFVYQLAEGLGQSDLEIDENSRNFWKEIYDDKLNNLQLKDFQQREAKTSDYIPLFKTDVEKLFLKL
jgi:hypothetical protein